MLQAEIRVCRIRDQQRQGGASLAAPLVKNLRDWGQEEKGTTEDEMAGWHH